MRLVKEIFGAMAIFAMALPNTTWAGETRSMTYDVFAGGIHALDATLIIQDDSKGYHIQLSSATHGLLGKLAPWSGEFKTDGNKASPSTVFPRSHISASTWKGSTETKNYTYDGKGHFVGYTVKEGDNDKTPKDLDTSLTTGTTDLLSATFATILQLDAQKGCASDNLIFDGDRNYHLFFKKQSSETLKKSDYNIYDGQAYACTVEVKPEKGKWKKKPRGWLSIQEQGRQQGGGLPVVWFGKPDKDVVGLYVPVKIRVKTAYGTLFMHLTSYKRTSTKAPVK